MSQATEDYKGATLPAAATDGTDEWGTTLNTAQKLIIDTVIGNANESALNASGHTHKKISNAEATASIDCSTGVTEITGPSNFGTMPTVHVSDGYNGDKSLALQESVDAKEDKSNKSTDGTLADNSDTKYPSQSAVKSYVNSAVSGKENSSNKSIDGAMTDDSDTLYPTQSAVISYVSSVTGNYALLENKSNNTALNSGVMGAPSGDKYTSEIAVKGYVDTAVAGSNSISKSFVMRAANDSTTIISGVTQGFGTISYFTSGGTSAICRFYFGMQQSCGWHVFTTIESALDFGGFNVDSNTPTINFTNQTDDNTASLLIIQPNNNAAYCYLINITYSKESIPA